MVYKPRKNGGRAPRSHGVKRPRAARNRASTSGVQKRANDIRRAKTYIKKAVEFGIESGYLIPSDSTYNLLRVSSDLMRNKLEKYAGRARNRLSSPDGDSSVDRSSSRLDKHEVQDAGRRKRRRTQRKSRSSSRRRRNSRRRRSRSDKRRTADTEDDFEMDDAKRPRNEDAEADKNRIPPNPPDGEKNAAKPEEEDGSEVSVDEDESDEDDKKNDDETQS